MTKHQLSRGLTIALCVSVFPLSAAAVTTTSASTATKLTNLKTKGAAEVDRRLSNLAGASERITAAKRLSDTDKAALTKQIQDEVTGLTALKAKLAAETAIAGARADVASVVTDYRVYALMLPKARLVAATDAADVAITNLKDLSAKLTTRLSAAKSNGKDTVALETKVAEINAALSEAAAKTDGLATKLLAIQPSDYNTSHTVLTGYRQSLNEAVVSINKAKAAAQQVIAGLKSL